MDWTTFFKDVCLAFVPVVGLFACTALHSIADYFVGKTNDTTTQKYIREIEEAIIKAVRTVAQTYTKKLKAQNAFGEVEERLQTARPSRWPVHPCPLGRSVTSPRPTATLTRSCLTASNPP